MAKKEFNEVNPTIEVNGITIHLQLTSIDIESMTALDSNGNSVRNVMQGVQYAEISVFTIGKLIATIKNALIMPAQLSNKPYDFDVYAPNNIHRLPLKSPHLRIV